MMQMRTFDIWLELADTGLAASGDLCVEADVQVSGIS